MVIVDWTNDVLKAHKALNDEMLEVLGEAMRQIEYLHAKFGETGSGNAVLLRICRVMQKANGDSNV